MATLGNILWLILFGWWQFIVYAFLGIVCCITVIGIPIGKSLFQYAKLMAMPFGKEIVKETFIKGKENVSAVRRFFGTLANILWLPFGVIILLLNVSTMLFCCITIVLIPDAVVIARSCKFLLWPIGAKVISQGEKQAILNAQYMAKYNERIQPQQPAPQPVQQPVSKPAPQPMPQPISQPVQQSILQPMLQPASQMEAHSEADVNQMPRVEAISNAQTEGGKVCPNCGNVNLPNAGFCRSCGTNLRDQAQQQTMPTETITVTHSGGGKVCPNCGNVNSPNAGFCRSCGTKLL